LRDLIFRARNGHDVASKFGARKLDLAVPFLLKLFDFTNASQEFTVVEAID
jgi:hypothetical protein